MGASELGEAESGILCCPNVSFVRLVRINIRCAVLDALEL